MPPVPEARQLARVNGEWRTSLVTDPPNGTLPLTPHGQDLQKAFPTFEVRTADNHEERSNTERCFGGPSRTPIMVPIERMYNQIVQTEDFVVFLADHYADIRMIGIGANHRPVELVGWVGDSVTRWDGDTLVVETKNLRPDEPVRNRLVFSAQSRDEALDHRTCSEISSATPDGGDEHDFVQHRFDPMRRLYQGVAGRDGRLR